MLLLWRLPGVVAYRGLLLARRLSLMLSRVPVVVGSSRLTSCIARETRLLLSSLLSVVRWRAGAHEVLLLLLLLGESAEITFSISSASRPFRLRNTHCSRKNELELPSPVAGA